MNSIVASNCSILSAVRNSSETDLSDVSGSTSIVSEGGSGPGRSGEERSADPSGTGGVG